MSSSSTPPSLPDFLFNAWQLRQDAASEAEARGDFKDWDASSLCSAYLKYQLNSYERDLQARIQTSAPSLISLSVIQILESLESSTDLPTDIKTLAAQVDGITLQRILLDPRTPYCVLRLVDASTSVNIKGSSGDRKLIDIDEAVRASEQYVCSKRPKSSEKHLVTLEDLSRLFGPLDADGLLTLRRKTPPKGGFEFLDQKRKPLVRIQGTDAAFIKKFDRVTKGILKGLDWDHVFVQGGMVINTLLHTDPTKDFEGDIAECDIDLYLYDLTPEEANLKVEEIYKIWSGNLWSNSGSNSPHIVVKNAQTINLIPQYPSRRIQIILKLLHSPLQSLLRIDLDACAAGFDGSRVFMLPRCARAIETGYSVFTLDLIWGHRLASRRESQENRVFKYADRGFGLRILPSYCRSLGKDLGGMTLSDVKDSSIDGNEVPTGPTRVLGGEPGLKTIRRLAYLARNFVHRYCELTREFWRNAGILSFQDNNAGNTIDEHGNDQDVRIMNGSPKSTRDVTEPNQPSLVITLSNLDGINMHDGFPNGPNSLGIFELFMRHCEAWRLDTESKVILARESTSAIVYDHLDFYGGLPTYVWSADSPISLEQFEADVNIHNSQLFRILRTAIGEKLNINPRQGRYVNYLTRRIRRVIVGPDLESVMKKQITMPLIIPMELQAYITDELEHQYDDLSDKALSKLLIPAHDPSRYDPSTTNMPSLLDTVDESGNLRYWLTTNESMWAGQHRVLDEVAELLRALFDRFMKNYNASDPDRQLRQGTDTQQCLWHLARIFRRRLILPGISNTLERGQILPEREARLFRAWALARPPRVLSYLGEDDEPTEKLEKELANQGDVPDELFWKDGDEGTWDDEAGVPVWQA